MKTRPRKYLFRLLMIAAAVLPLSSTLPGRACAATLRYDLGKCLEMALERHPKIQIEHFETVRSEALRKAARSRFLPRLGLEYSYLHRDKINSYDINNYSFPANTNDSFQLDIAVVQPLFTGFSLLENYRLAELGLKESRTRQELARLQLIYETTSAYFAYLKQLRFAATAARSVARLEAQAHDAKLFYDSNLIPLNELLYSKVKLSQARQRRRRIETRVKLARSRLALLMQLDRDREFTVVDHPVLEKIGFTLARASAVARTRRPELRLANYAVSSAGHRIKLAQSEFYPAVSLKIAHSRMGDRWDVGGDGITSTPHNTYIGVNARWQIWEWGRRREMVNSARAEEEKARQALKEAADKISLEVKENFENALTSYRNIETAKEELELSRENYRVTKLRFQNQLATATDLLDAQAALTQAEAAYDNAVYDYNIQLAALARAAGVEKWTQITTATTSPVSEKRTSADR
ncbi:MAG: TolC family protein [Deltaproteobacteria bacterium]|nr:TolC family protein [Deltaproteobacteria bacterium]